MSQMWLCTSFSISCFNGASEVEARFLLWFLVVQDLTVDCYVLCFSVLPSPGRTPSTFKKYEKCHHSFRVASRSRYIVVAFVADVMRICLRNSSTESSCTLSLSFTGLTVPRGTMHRVSRFHAVTDLFDTTSQWRDAGCQLDVVEIEIAVQFELQLFPSFRTNIALCS